MREDAWVPKEGGDRPEKVGFRYTANGVSLGYRSMSFRDSCTRFCFATSLNGSSLPISVLSMSETVHLAHAMFVTPKQSTRVGSSNEGSLNCLAYSVWFSAWWLALYMLSGQATPNKGTGSSDLPAMAPRDIGWIVSGFGLHSAHGLRR
jgi:hypothetical protein